MRARVGWQWWQQSSRLVAAALLAIIVCTVSAPLIDWFGIGGAIFGIPASIAMVTLALPALLVGILLLHNRRQSLLDLKNDIPEGPDE